ncbi:putative aldolase class 2 protein CC_1201 [Asterias amurensis]|uniref:putative aldolase class 2 protein CC_1201 n=1 Tax=Asterias amurensis TaxID=7602 RepID=UPI003AB8E9D5
MGLLNLSRNLLLRAAFSNSTRRTFSIVGNEAEQANQRAREDLATSYRGFDYYGMGEGVCNHLTLMAPARNGQGKVMLLIPYGLHWSQVTAKSLIGVDIHSTKLVEGDGLGEDSAVAIHSSMYRASGDAISCVMHLHPPYATGLACLKDPRLKMVHQTSMRYFGKIAYDREYGGTGDTGDESERLARNLQGKQIMIMCNHGIVGVGQSAAEVFDNVYYFERAAMFQNKAESSGREVEEVSDKVAKGVADYFDDCGISYKIAHFEGIKNLLLKRDSDFLL